MKSERNQLNRALLDSVIMRDVDRVRELLRQGADLNARDEEHLETPLILAVKFCGIDMVRLLIEAGAEVEARNAWNRTALFYAPVSSEVFKLLLEVGADIHARDGEGNTILMRNVARSASISEVEEILRLGVDPSAKNESGETALDIAEELGLVNVVQQLGSRKA